MRRHYRREAAQLKALAFIIIGLLLIVQAVIILTH